MKRKKLRWRAERWKAKKGKDSYHVVKGDQGYWALFCDNFNRQSYNVSEDKITKRAAIAACERHNRERRGK